MVTELKFHHVVNVREDESRIATARDSNNRIHIYLINKFGNIYKRNGLRSTWDPVELRIKESLRILIESASHSASNYKVDHI